MQIRVFSPRGFWISQGYNSQASVLALATEPSAMCYLVPHQTNSRVKISI